jgi:hypothetical protein
VGPPPPVRDSALAAAKGWLSSARAASSGGGPAGGLPGDQEAAGGLLPLPSINVRSTFMKCIFFSKFSFLRTINLFDEVIIALRDCGFTSNPFALTRRKNLTHFRRFLIVLEYSLAGLKFPPFTGQRTLYTVKKKLENFQ